MIWSKRSEKLELLDLGPAFYTQAEYRDCLDKLNLVGEYLGGDRASLKVFEKLTFSPSSILDVGCGGGGFTQKLGCRYPESAIKGIDISQDAIDHAKTVNQLKNVEFEVCDLLKIPSKSYDVVITTLVCHHLPDHEIVSFLKNCLRVAKRQVIINDLHRHPVAWLAFLCSAPLLFRNRLITHDGALSIQRAFIRKDWNRYLNQMDIQGNISWHFPFRWTVTLVTHTLVEAT